MNISANHEETMRGVEIKTRSTNWLVKRRWFLLFVGVPTLLAIIYYGFIATAVYVSQSTFVIKSPNQKSAPNLSLANIVQTSGLSSGQEQTKEILQYIRSRNALRDLEKQTDVRAKFSGSGVDFLSRFPRPFRLPSFEHLYRFYGSMVGADLDPDSGLAVVQVRAFHPKDAYEINVRLLNLSEALVNRLNQRAEGRAITEGERRVLAAEQRVGSARAALSSFRNRESLIDPGKEAEAVLDISSKLVAEQAALQAQLELMLRVAPRNPAIPTLRSRIAAVGRSIAGQTGRAVGTPTGIESKLSRFEKLSAEQEFAMQTLTAANASLEQARAESQKQQFYLERVVSPNEPDAASLPRRMRQILIIFAASLCLYFIGWMIVIGILEHAPED